MLTERAFQHWQDVLHGLEENLTVIDCYKTVLLELKGELENRFMDFKNIKDDISAFSAILQVNVPRHLQNIEVIQLKNYLVYAPLFAPDQDLLKAYQSLPSTYYPRIRSFAARFLSMFASAYHTYCALFNASLLIDV